MDIKDDIQETKYHFKLHRTAYIICAAANDLKLDSSRSEKKVPVDIYYSFISDLSIHALTFAAI